MKWLALILVSAVLIRHGASRWLGDLFSMDSRMVFYILGGWLEVLLCAATWLLLRAYKSDYRHLAVTACLIGLSEGVQIAVCGMLQTPIIGKNLCDAYFGKPVGATLVSIYALYLCNYVGRNKMNNRTLMLVPIVSAAEVSYLTSPYLGVGLLALCYAVWRRHGQPT